MKAKSKSNIRVKVNTAILVLCAAVFGAMTCSGVKQLDKLRVSLNGVSDAPALCYDEEKYNANADYRVIEGTYPCLLETDENGENVPAESPRDVAMFIYDRVSLTSSMLSTELDVVVVAIGSMFTVASLAGAVVYYNHNRE